MNCLPGCGQPTSATFSHAPGCPNANWHDVPQPAPQDDDWRDGIDPQEGASIPNKIGQPAPGRFEEEMSELVCCAIEAGHDGSDENIERLHVAEQTLCAAHAAEVEAARHDNADNSWRRQMEAYGYDSVAAVGKMLDARHAAGVAEGYRKGFHAAAKEMFCRECTGGMQTLSAARAEGRRAMAREHLAKHLSLGCSEAAHKEDVCEERRWLESQAREGKKETE